MIVGRFFGLNGKVFFAHFKKKKKFYQMIVRDFLDSMHGQLFFALFE
jgi:hypothetical protein